MTTVEMIVPVRLLSPETVHLRYPSLIVRRTPPFQTLQDDPHCQLRTYGSDHQRYCSK